jgi:hypothetical protein
VHWRGYGTPIGGSISSFDPVHPVFLLTGLCWAATYLLIIRRGFADRTYGVPIVALCANLSWEFIFAVVRPQAEGAQQIGYFVWLMLDLVIVYTVLRFGPREFPYLPRPVFYAGFAGTLVLAYLGVDMVCREFDNGKGAYAGFAVNLMMSGLFLAMLASRRGLRGQSVSIAAWKFVGTIFASLGFWLYGDRPDSAVLMYMYIANGVVDAAYLAAVAVVRAHTRTGAVRAQEGTEAVTLGR